jgi:hypothetical protein
MRKCLTKLDRLNSVNTQVDLVHATKFSALRLETLELKVFRFDQIFIAGYSIIRFNLT